MDKRFNNRDVNAASCGGGGGPFLPFSLSDYLISDDGGTLLIRWNCKHLYTFVDGGGSPRWKKRLLGDIVLFPPTGYLLL